MGDWNTADATTPSASGWGGGWAGDATPQKQHLTPIPKDEGFGFGSPSPIAWPGSIAVSPGAKHAAGTPSRQPLDPWASDSEEPRNGQDAPRFVIDRPASPTSVGELDEEKLEEPVSPWDHNDNHGYLHVETAAPAVDDDDGGRTTPPTAAPHDTKTAEGYEQSDSLEQSQDSVGSKPRSSHSRSSSVSRNDSDHDTDRQDSPITSIDEDARSRVALPPRKVSGRIQVLVEKFDGLAKAAVEEPSPVRRERSVTPHPPDARMTETPVEDTADFGDFEDAGDVEERPATPPPAVHPMSSDSTPEPISTPQTRIRDSHIEQPSPTSTRGRSSTAGTTVSSHVHNVASKFSDVRFDVDVGMVDTLFKDINLDSIESHESSEELPDYPITDSFTDMSERKVWYRISRQGSSRKHNFGDWDSYQRIAWQTSALHADVLKIVRRWMEQDSIIGRTTLGGGTTKTDIFGWDSAAEPVALEKVFARRQRPVARPMSLQQPLQMPPTVIPEVSVPASRKPSGGQRPSSLAGPPTAAFGWSTSPVEQRPVEPAKLTDAKKPVLAAIQGPTPRALSDTPMDKHSMVPIPPSVSQQDEDEDDWGEMISSPVEVPKVAPIEAAFFEPPTQAVPPSTSHDVSRTTRDSPPPSREGDQSIIPTQFEPSEPKASSKSPPSTEDPWASNDLSILEQAVNPTANTSIATSKTAFMPTTPLAIISPLTVSDETPIDQIRSMPSDEEDSAETESLIRRITGGLPDLSYMLR